MIKERACFGKKIDQNTLFIFSVDSFFTFKASHPISESLK